MTLDELTGMSADQLEKLSDKELLEWFEQQGYLNVTRPERNRRVETAKKEQPAIYFSPQKQAAFEQLRQQGVDIDSILKKARKK